MSQSSTCGLNPVRADRLLFSVQTSNLTVLRVFGTGADTSFQLTLQPGTAGADGKTWPNGMETLSLGRPTSPLRKLVHEPSRSVSLVAQCHLNARLGSPLQWFVMCYVVFCGIPWTAG